MSLPGDKRTDRKRIIVGVSGGIAAYKAATVVRQLTEAGHQVRVIPTESALRFVGAATFEALSGERVQTGVFEDVPLVPHVPIRIGICALWASSIRILRSRLIASRFILETPRAR